MMRIAAVGFGVVMAVQAFLSAAQVRQTFRTRVDLVQVDVLVLDKGKPVTGLTASDFELRDDDVPQRIDAVSLEQMPLDVLLVFDTSKSVAGQPLADLSRAAEAFIGALDGRDRAALITFSDQPSLRMPLTGNIRSLGESLRAVSTQTSTALLDAVELALASRSGSDRRTVLLVLTDGQDNTSWLTPDQVLAAAQRSEATVYVVGLDPAFAQLRALTAGAPRSIRDTTFLQRLVGDTGGRLVYADSTRNLQQVFLRLLREMKSRYVLTYYPEGVAAAGWHTLDVRLRRRSGTVTARRGYFAGT